MLRYVVANLIAGLLRPLVWAALAMLAAAFVITVPARLWMLFVDPQASAHTTAALNWTTGVLLAGVWVSPWLLPVLGYVVGHVSRRRAR